MHMSDDEAVPDRFHGVAEDIAGYCLDDILHEFRTVGFDTFPFLCGTAAFTSDGFAAELVLTDSGLHVGETTICGGGT